MEIVAVVVGIELDVEGVDDAGAVEAGDAVAESAAVAARSRMPSSSGTEATLQMFMAKPSAPSVKEEQGPGVGQAPVEMRRLISTSPSASVSPR